MKDKKKRENQSYDYIQWKLWMMQLDIGVEWDSGGRIGRWRLENNLLETIERYMNALDLFSDIALYRTQWQLAVHVANSK